MGKIVKNKDGSVRKIVLKNGGKRMKKWIKRLIAKIRYRRFCKSEHLQGGEGMITSEQFKEAIKKGEVLFSINEDFTIRVFIPKRFAIEAWNYLSGGQYPRVVITDSINREYSPDNVFATETEAKEKAKRQLIERLAELDQAEAMGKK